MIGRPSSARYEKLFQTLLAVEKVADAGEIDRLHACFKTLFAVIEFLNADPEIIKQNAAKSLCVLLNTLNDTLQGSKPKLLFGRPPITGAPKNLSGAVLRAQVVLAIELLLESDSPRSASEWLAGELLRNEIKLGNGEPITGKTILRWRNEKGGKSLSGSDSAHAKLSQHRTKRDWKKNTDTARSRVEGLIKSLKATGF